MAAKGYVGTVWEVLAGLIAGMRVTLRTLLRPAITVQYPFEKLTPYPGYRGVLHYDPATCIACGLCAKACPSSCITVKKGASYSVHLGRCNFCRLCEEACPTKPKSIRHSPEYELVFLSRSQMERTWELKAP
ncbi:MAG: NADH-quinone oxidoreductase subunit I [Elusimicrobiota bacterium]